MGEVAYMRKPHPANPVPMRLIKEPFKIPVNITYYPFERKEVQENEGKILLEQSKSANDPEDEIKTKQLYPFITTVRVTREMEDQLKIIAAFEATKPSTLARVELLSMIRRYERNPQFKNWVKRMEKTWRK